MIWSFSKLFLQRVFLGRATGALLVALTAGISIQVSANQPSITTLLLTRADGRAVPADIYLDGEITPGIVHRLEAELNRYKIKHGTLYFNSKGGDLHAAMELGSFIRSSGLNTAIGAMGSGYGQPALGSCESACVLAFAGGRYRFSEKDSYFGVHQFYSRTTGAHDLALGQVVSAAITGYLLSMGVSPRLFTRMVSAGATSQQLHVQEAANLGLVNNGVLPARWEIRGSGGSVFLHGEQETWNGVGQARISCTPREPMRFTALFDAGHNTQHIKAITRSFAMLAGGDLVPVTVDPTNPPRIEQQTLVTEFVLSKQLINLISHSRSIGFAWRPASPDTFHGYQISTSQHVDLISSFLNHCSKTTSL